MVPILTIAAVFAILVLAAVSIACWPLLRDRKVGFVARVALGAVIALGVVVPALAIYVRLGSPALALRDVAAPSDVRSLIAALAHRAREGKFDVTGWSLLGRGYLSLGDAADAASAFRRAADLAPRGAKPGILSAYGEALTMANSGTVTSEAELAFRAALSQNPKDFAARYYLGLALAGRGRSSEAIAEWKGLLADAPKDAAWRSQVLDRLAALESTADSAPDIPAMVARLASRLKANPDDPEGWQRLVRAYVVLGNPGAARAALVRAQNALKKNPDALVSLDAEAKSLQLQ